MALEKYKQKRKFKSTPEPKGKALKKLQQRFVIHEHHASHLHYDFRLEMESKIDSGEIVLKSWAVPKNLPEKVGERRLAVEVEDHPVDYINFYGVIPEGNYGAGTVKIWDNGKYDLIRRTEKEIEFILHGKKLNGPYVLVKTHFSKNSWLIIKLKE
ncbi:MAG: DNA polymerase ligase N-terminal domain-containing protein [Patescibacteria group bacterium]|nr:DNA polymerase ligase N-terminal domain-containing protein [Patescibacteria group bacterium]